MSQLTGKILKILNSLHRNRTLLIILASIANLGIVLFIPSHPDDFSTYHALACGFPAQHINVYHAPCNSYFHDFGPFRYQQDYEYVGVANSLVMWFFTLVFTPLVSHYLWGILALILTAIGLVNSFNLQSNWILIFFYIPVTYPILHDDSPIRFSIIFFAWTPFLLKKAFASERFVRFVLFLLVSLGWLLSTEDKPFFVYLLPGLFFLHLAQEGKSNFAFGRYFSQRAALYALLFLPTMFFLVVSRMGGKPYLLYLADNNQTFTRGYFRSIATAVLHLFSWFAFPVRAVDYNYAPGRVQPESAEALPWGNGIISILSLVVLIIIAILFLRFYGRLVLIALKVRQSETSYFVLLSTISVFLLFLLPISGGAWSGHHYVFAHVAILVLLLKHLKKFTKRNSSLILMILCCSTIALTALTPPRSYNSSDSRRAIDFAYQLAGQDTIINCAYSCYYEYSLRNIGNVPVTFATSLDEGSRLGLYVVKNNQELIHICKLCSSDSNREIFGEGSHSEKMAQYGAWYVYSLSFSEGQS